MEKKKIFLTSIIVTLCSFKVTAASSAQVIGEESIPVVCGFSQTSRIASPSSIIFKGESDEDPGESLSPIKLVSNTGLGARLKFKNVSILNLKNINGTSIDSSNVSFLIKKGANKEVVQTGVNSKYYASGDNIEIIPKVDKTMGQLIFSGSGSRAEIRSTIELTCS